jgi:hypothetical protein
MDGEEFFMSSHKGVGSGKQGLGVKNCVISAMISLTNTLSVVL